MANDLYVNDMLEIRSIASVPHYILRAARYGEAPIDPDPRSSGFLAYLKGLVLESYIGIVGCPPFHQPNIANDSHRPGRAVLRRGDWDRCTSPLLDCFQSRGRRSLRGRRRSVQRFELQAYTFHEYAARAMQADRFPSIERLIEEVDRDRDANRAASTAEVAFDAVLLIFRSQRCRSRSLRRQWL
jgi:hypothetical protein